MMRDPEAQALLDAYIAKQSVKPGPLYGRVLLGKDHYAAGANGTVYVYRGGVYVPAPMLIKQRIQEEAGDTWSRHIQGEVEGWLIANAPPLDLNALGPNRINVRNGILTRSKSGWRLRPHSPRYRTPVQFPVTYNPRAKCPLYDEFLRTSLPDPDVRALADEWMGFNLTPDYRFHKALLTTGESGSGKSVFLEVLMGLLGSENVSVLSLTEITKDVFGLDDMYGKAANIAFEIEAAELRSTGNFKKLVAGELVRGQAKHKPAFKFRSTAKLSFSANELPPSRDTSSAFFERWLVMIFPHKFRGTPKDKLGLKADITGSETEMSGVLNRALAGLTSLRRQRGFTASVSSEEAWRLLREKADVFASWLMELPPGAHGRRRREDWYALYRDWCRESGHQALSSTKFYDRAKRWGVELGVEIRYTTSKGYDYIRIEEVGVVGGSRSYDE